MTIGVHGDWGAGKSSVLEMIEAGFESESKVLCLKFNGWRFRGFEDAKIALIEGIVTGLIEKRPALTKAGEAVKDVFRSIDWLKVAKKAGGLAFTAFTGIPTPEQIGAIVGTLEGFLSDPAELATKENVQSAIDGVKGLLKERMERANIPEEINAFRKTFDDLLERPVSSNSSYSSTTSIAASRTPRSRLWKRSASSSSHRGRRSSSPPTKR